MNLDADTLSRGRPAVVEITPALIEHIKEMRSRNMPKKAIATALHMDVRRVERVLQNLGMAQAVRHVTWSDEEIERLRSLWQAGLSARSIAHRLGKSRSAVLGKASRLGLSRSKEFRPSHVSYGPKATKKIRQEVIVPEFSGAVLIDGAHIGIMDLKPSMCRWPIGDPRDEDFHFCGHKKLEERAYCAFHYMRSITKVISTPRVRKKIPAMWLRGIAA